jgi:outer membrane protein
MKKFIMASAAVFAMSAVAHAADVAPVVMDQKDWFVKVGVSGIFFEPSLSNVTLAGAPFAGGAANIGSNVTGSIELGRFITKNIALTVEGGIPPTTTFTGAGNFAGLGTVATATYGFAAAGVELHPIRDGQLDPYIDGGVAYNILFSYTPGPAVANLSIPNSLGGYVGAGVGMKLKDNWGMYVSAKQFFLSTNISGTIIPIAAPVTATAQLNPFVVSAGLSYNF